MHNTVKRRVLTSDNLVLLVAVLVAIGAFLMQSSLGMAQRWHAATAWTRVPFSVVVVTYRRYWSFWRFWASLAICLALHLGLMWLIFGRLLARVEWLGTASVIPFEFVEGFVLLGLVAVFMHRLGHPGKYIRL